MNEAHPLDPEETHATPAAAVGLERLLTERHSCRAFLDRPVDRDVLTRILSLAQKTASWCNSQPWQIYIASKAATDRIRPQLYAQGTRTRPNSDFEFPGEYLGVYKDRRRACAAQLYEAVGIEFGDRVASGRQAAENFNFFGAPHVAIVTTDRNLGVYGAIDCGAYLSNFMLAAQSLEVATIAQAALAAQSQFLREALEIPDDRLIVCGISLGYADMNSPVNRFRTTRAAVCDVVKWIEK